MINDLELSQYNIFSSQNIVGKVELDLQDF